MRSIDREIASSSLKKSARGTSGISVYVKTSYSYIVSFCARSHTHTYTYCIYIYIALVHFLPAALFHPTSIFLGNLLPGATLSVAIAQTTCLFVCVRVSVCIGVRMYAHHYTIARKSASIRAGVKSLEYRDGLN